MASCPDCAASISLWRAWHQRTLSCPRCGAQLRVSRFWSTVVLLVASAVVTFALVPALQRTGGVFLPLLFLALILLSAAGALLVPIERVRAEERQPDEQIQRSRD